MTMLAQYTYPGMMGWYASSSSAPVYTYGAPTGYGYPSMGMMRWWPGQNYGYGFSEMPLSLSILMILWWVFVAGIVVMAVRWIFGWRRGSRRSGGSAALDILAERYARGEIDKKEYEAKKKDLS